MSEKIAFHLSFLVLFLFYTTLWPKTNAVIFPEYHCWNGLNPFFQPTHTLNYYGSGDVDNNSQIDKHDLDSLQHLVNFKATTNYRADLNGDGAISHEDITLLNLFLESSKPLPSHWNSLTKAQRISWLKRCLALDITSSIPGELGSFACGNFDTQFYLNFSYFGGIVSHTTYTGGGTIFNIPVYSVTFNGHGFNAVLIGDNPLSFDDWYFIEPQKSTRITPPAVIGKGIILTVPTFILQNSRYGDNIIKATRTEGGWNILQTAAGLITQRPLPPSATNYIDMIPSWNPRIVQMDKISPIIFFERLNEQIPPSTSIYIARVVNGTISDPIPLIFDKMAARLLDIQHSQEGKVNLLWRGTRDFRPVFFTGEVDIKKRTVENISESTKSMITGAAALSVSDGFKSAFWLTEMNQYGVSDSILKHGINRSVIKNSDWSTPQNIVYFTPRPYVWPSWSRHLLYYYSMDILTTRGNSVLLSVPHINQQQTSRIQLWFNHANDWRAYSPQNDSLVTGARVTIDRNNVIHCVFWATYGGDYWKPEGKVMYRSFRDFKWSDPVILDSSINNHCTDITVNERNDLLTVWSKSVSKKKSVFCTRVYSNGNWQPIETHHAPDNESVWYPRITALHDTNYIVAWESRGKYKTQIRCKILYYSPQITLISSGNNLAKTFGKIGLRIQNNQLFIETDRKSALPAIINLFDTRGRVLYNARSADIGKYHIGLQAMNSGLYFVTISPADTTYTFKISVFNTKISVPWEVQNE